MMNITPTVKQLLIINVLFYIGSMIVGEPAYKLLSMYFFESPDFRFWQIFTHMFMHAPLPNIMHIAFNMFALYSFGSALEHFWGGRKFVFFYISCGLGAALLHTVVNYYFFENGINLLVENGYQKVEILKILSEGKFDTKWQELLTPSDFQAFMGAYLGNVVGASGAIYGLLVAFAFMFPNAELALMFIPIPIKAKYFVPGLLLIDLYLGVSGGSLFGGSSGIAHFAHLGGALVGYLMMWYWKKNQFNNHRWN
ncbi:rhomboid family intramembrane serine protease [Flavobacterium granuli]|uniref:Membrane associated rhomboid family serine protease n=1 Tax=Flavobacterium granuli TaxID=280093 RepID=A0ABU1S8Q9_9FLAO|nr:rhomboid family intramembrane serine protease [Flavobacterium granuli]MDR6846634.1 membrane associated rhomboid family serine protease [Flavobacterium granuli]